MKRNPVKVFPPQKFALGERVKINRPHLWSGNSGEVVSFADGQHRIRIKGKDEGFFHTEATAEFLERLT
jgi:hypothetical protein